MARVSLTKNPFFSILADDCEDDCEDVSTKEKLLICCRWVLNGKPEEHFYKSFTSLLLMLQKLLKHWKALLFQGSPTIADWQGKDTKGQLFFLVVEAEFT